jgi:two-component system, NarL family, response regulator NreC
MSDDPTPAVAAETQRILIADDHVVMRQGLQMLLERERDLECVGEVGTAEDALRAVERLHPDIVILDLGMPGIGGLAGLEKLRGRHPDLPVLVLSMEDRPEIVRDAFAAGANGYLVKTAADQELVQAIRATLAGERYLQPTMGAALARHQRDPGPLDELSEREREVLGRLALGMTNQEIADELIVSPRTVESHRAHIMTKLRASTRAEMVRIALQAGLLDSVRTGDAPDNAGPPSHR